MNITFIKISDKRHVLKVMRVDGTCESVELESREFLRHDLSHFVIERELPIPGGYWGNVASGGSLAGEDLAGGDMMLAESLAGPMQTLFRREAGPDAYEELLCNVSSGKNDLAARVHECIRQLRGRWKATPFGGEMELEWPESWQQDNS